MRVGFSAIYPVKQSPASVCGVRFGAIVEDDFTARSRGAERLGSGQSIQALVSGLDKQRYDVLEKMYLPKVQYRYNQGGWVGYEYNGWQILRLIRNLGQDNSVSVSLKELKTFLAKEREAAQCKAGEWNNDYFPVNHVDQLVRDLVKVDLVKIETNGSTNEGSQEIELTPDGQKFLDALGEKELDRSQKEQAQVLEKTFIAASSVNNTGISDYTGQDILRLVRKVMVDSGYTDGDAVALSELNELIDPGKKFNLTLSLTQALRDLAVAGFLEIAEINSNQEYRLSDQGKNILGVGKPKAVAKAVVSVPKSDKTYDSILSEMLFGKYKTLKAEVAEGITGRDLLGKVGDEMLKWPSWRNKVHWYPSTKFLLRSYSKDKQAGLGQGLFALQTAGFLKNVSSLGYSGSGPHWQTTATGCDVLEYGNPLNDTQALSRVLEERIEFLKNRRFEESQKVERFTQEHDKTAQTLAQLQTDQQKARDLAMAALKEADAATDAKVKSQKEAETLKQAAAAEDFEEQILFHQECTQILSEYRQTAQSKFKELQTVVGDQLKKLIKAQAQIEMNKLGESLMGLMKEVDFDSQMTQLNTDLEELTRKLDESGHSTRFQMEKSKVEVAAETAVREKVSELKQRRLLQELRQHLPGAGASEVQQQEVVKTVVSASTSVSGAQ